MYRIPYNQKTAFTLAEVLITLLIIGIVASIVIPNLINDTQNQEYYTLLKKDFSTFSNAIKLMMMDNGGTLIGFFNDENDIVNKFGNYIILQKKCNGSTQGCFYSGKNTWKNLYGDYGWYDHTSYSTAILSNGGLVSFIFDSPTCSRDYGTGSPMKFTCLHLHVDVNGFKGPNVLGRDIFAFWVTKTGIYPMGMSTAGYNSTTYCSKNNPVGESGRGCASVVLSGETIP